MIKKIFILALMIDILTSLILLSYGTNFVINFNVGFITSLMILISAILSYSKMLKNAKELEHKSKISLVLLSAKSIFKILSYLGLIAGFLLLQKFGLFLIIPYIIGLLLSLIVVVTSLYISKT